MSSMSSLCWKCGAPPAASMRLEPLPAVPLHLAHLFACNDAPFGAEIPSIRGLLVSSQERLNLLDSQIDDLQSTLARLIGERTETAEFVRQHTAVLSPFRRVPPELICEILALALPCTRRLHEYVVNQPPWRFGHICRSWRHAALAYPRLWSSINLYHSRAVPIESSFPLAAIETQLGRVADLPLQVTLESRDPDDVKFDPDCFTCLVSQCARWDVFHIITYSASSIVFDLLRPVTGCLPLLHTLELVTPGQPRPEIFSVAPNLHTVLLTNENYDHYSPHLAIPWNQIIHYRGVYVAQRQLDILRAASNLVDVGVGFPIEAGVAEDEVVTLPRLRRLCSKDSHFLTYLRAPALETLFLQYTIDDVPSFLQRSSCQLTKLVVEYPVLSTAFITALQSMPTLRHLVLGSRFPDQHTPNAFFQAMELSGASSDMCPNLTAFTYGVKHEGRRVPEGLLAMLRSRIQPSVPCRLTVFRFIVPIADRRLRVNDMTRQLKMLSDDGLDVAVISFIEGRALMTEERP